MFIKIIEVGPRDGLQNETKSVSFADKIKFIELLAKAGFQEIEAGAFVSPKWVPQMADTEKIFQYIHRKLQSSHPQTEYSALVPNMKGMEKAVRCGVKKIALFTAASETFNQKNINCSIQESLERFKPVIQEGQKNNMILRAYVSTAFVCPYEGNIHSQAVVKVVQQIMDLGVHEVSIGDTVGKATPDMVKQLLQELTAKFPVNLFAMHFHDTYKRALMNVEVSLEFGISKYDSSAGGIGGCPYAPGARGNVSTDDLVLFLGKKGHQTGIDLENLKKASEFMRSILARQV